VTAIDPGQFTRLFFEGFAQLLASLGTGLTWRANLAYVAGETGIYPMSLPAATPNRAVALAPYPLSADPTLSQSEIGLQVVSRGAANDYRDVWLIDDAVQKALLGLYPITLANGVRVEALQWTSGGSMGLDDSQRCKWSSNFTVRTYRPSTNRH
jgi:hypothetical protein